MLRLLTRCNKIATIGGKSKLKISDNTPINPEINNTEYKPRGVGATPGCANVKIHR